MSDNLPPVPTLTVETDTLNTVTNISGGVNLDAQGDVHIGGDVVGRDKNVFQFPIWGVLIVAVSAVILALVILVLVALSLTRPSMTPTFVPQQATSGGQTPIALTPISIPSATPTPTPTAEIVLTKTPADAYLLEDNFDDGILDTTNLWKRYSCPQGTMREHDGQVWFELPLNEDSDWHGCSLELKDAPKIRKVIVRATLITGTDELSWIGIDGYCGNEQRAFMFSPDGISEGHGITTTLIERLSGSLPITITLGAEWTGSKLVLTIADSSTQKSIDCSKPPGQINIGAGVRYYGHLEGSIDDVRVWKVP